MSLLASRSRTLIPASPIRCLIPGFRIQFRIPSSAPEVRKVTGDAIQNRPYSAYAAISGVFVGGVALAAAGAHRRAFRPYTTLDVALLALATFKVARTVARDNIASFIREPFVEEARESPHEERPVPTGDIRQAVGELVTCTRCVGTWAAAGITATEALAPSFGRILVRSLALGGANDWLQAGFAAFTAGAPRRQS
jgi:Protein of unknown function (DUF1360)